MAAAAAATAEEYEEMLRVVEAIATRIRWRLRPHSKRRLLNDILFLCSGLRPVVLMDYGGTMPELQDNLCSLLHHARQESSMLSPLRLMVIKDMLYLIHAKGLAEHASPSASAETATQNLSKHSLHIYRIYAVRCRQSAAKQSEQELMSFSVPCDMSTKRDEEPWAKSFLAHMNEKIKQCNHVWASVRMEIEVFHSQSGLIVL
ncbi:hypothetical protein DAI22_09g164401 [Oryza sativa Japonica Group]|nr:hypothetical protein DAI22_09g164401 [Oryza sativa Japonica Group]